MRFLAMQPGVHTIDGLVLTDVDLGESINLRYVLAFTGIIAELRRQISELIHLRFVCVSTIQICYGFCSSSAQS